VEPGSNPGFLYQQNTIRDALVAGLTLNIFHHHCDRIHMANIAQTINVLQSMILTEGARMILTPTYHVFEMFSVHQDATYLPIHLEEGEYEVEGGKIARLSASASRDASGKIHVSLCNLHHEEDSDLAISLRGEEKRSVKGRILTAPKMDSHNTFQQPDQVKPRDFAEVRSAKGQWEVKLPARSVLVLELS
jgi:alpha-N-arabinofuranosidase